MCQELKPPGVCGCSWRAGGQGLKTGGQGKKILGKKTLGKKLLPKIILGKNLLGMKLLPMKLLDKKLLGKKLLPKKIFPGLLAAFSWWIPRPGSCRHRVNVSHRGEQAADSLHA